MFFVDFEACELLKYRAVIVVLVGGEILVTKVMVLMIESHVGIELI